jgi:predicted RNA binding protein YcfA (HicA-like mRNA interferase family)
MPRRPRLTGRQLIGIFSEHGFAIIRVRGSHHVMRLPDGRQTVVPVHSGDVIGPGLLRKIMNQAELSEEDFQ